MFGGHADDTQPVRNELTAKKSVHPIYLQYNVSQAHELAYPILCSIPSMFSDVGEHVVDQYFLLLFALLLGTQSELQAHDQRGHQRAFLHVPHPFGEVAQHGLEEQSKAHPLVVRIIFGRFAVFGPNAWVRGAHALFPLERVRHGESGRDPAVRVYRPGGQPVNDALDRIAHVLSGRHHYGAREQHDRSKRDVHPENRAIDGHWLPLDELLEPA